MNDENPMIDTGEAIEQGARIKGAERYRLAACTIRNMSFEVNGIAKHVNAYRRLDGGCDGAHQYHDEDLAVARALAAGRLAMLPKDTQAVILGLIADLAAGGEKGAVENAFREALDSYHADHAYWAKHEAECGGCAECDQNYEL